MGTPLCFSFRGAGTGFLDFITWRPRISVDPGEESGVLAAPPAQQSD